MNMNRPQRQKRMVAALLATGLIGASFAAHADEREDLERLRATVLSLVDTLVKNGILPRDKVDAMMREAEVRASARLALLPPPELGADGKKIVRVAYVPESVKVQMREQVRAEVLAQQGVRAAGDAADPGKRIRVEGDLRLRGEMTRLSADNTPASAYDSGATLTRAPDFLTLGGNNKDLHTINTQENASRLRLRARLGAEADLTSTVTASIGITTGTTSGPTSDNQTLAQNGYFNKSTLVLDRAAIKIAPASWFSLTGGRIRNPYAGTDLLWADDLNFEGVAMTLKPQLSPGMGTFLTAGWFPLSPSTPKQSHGRSLLGIQAGIDWQLGQKENRLKLAAAIYDFRGIEGIAETQKSYQTGTDYVVRSEYAAGYRQRGNTLFRINAPASIDSSTNWGLASRFRELDLTGTVDVAQFDPLHVILTGDLVRNIGFKRSEIAQRTGAAMAFVDGKSLGYLTKIQVGNPLANQSGNWNASLAYRYLGSDAVVDAFTNSDFGLGGTNSKGTILGLNYGLAANTWVSARWLSSNLIDSIVPATAVVQKTKFSTDLIQIDLNTRF